MRCEYFLYCLVLGVFACPGFSEQTRAGGFLPDAQTGGEFRAVPTKGRRLLRAARLRLFDGRRKKSVRLGPARIISGAPGLRIEYETDLSGLKVSLHLKPHHFCHLWQVTFRNDSGEQLWLETGPELDLDSARNLRFFDGYQDDQDAPKKLYQTDQLRLNFPMTIAWTPETAVGVGIAPTELVSYLRHEFRPGERPVLGSFTRVVVDAGKTGTVAFVTCATRGAWGKFEVFQAYYDSFPKWFVPMPGIDPRALLGPAEYRSYPVRKWSPEICRRLWAGWEWCYAPFRRTGDIAGRPELWEYQPARPMGKQRALPRDKFLARRQRAFSDGQNACNIAMMFYIPAQIWCEDQLARNRYPDALTKDPKVRTFFGQPWVTGHDNDTRVFPYGTSFGRQSRTDMEEVTRDLELSGFAFDTAGGTARYRGPALPGLESRAWDEDGVYCNENVAVSRLMDFTHTLRKRGRPLAVVGNIGTGVYSSCLHSDVAMLEGEPWKNHRTFGDRLRWKMGHKPCVWWESYGLENLVDLNAATADSLRRVYRGLADFTLIQSLRIGLLPPPNFTQGVRRLVRWLPALIECVQTGWEPVPAARVPAPAWASRYGRGLNTLLAFAHETGQAMSADARVENSRLGSGYYLFSTYHDGKQRNRFVKGDTVLPIRLPVRTPALLRATAMLEPTGEIRQAEVTWRKGISGATLEVRLEAEPGQANLAVRIPGEMALHSITLNGRPFGETQSTSPAKFSLNLTGEDTFVAQFRSNLFHCSDEALLSFPFVKDGRANSTVILPARAGPRARLAASRIREYFQYWYAQVQKPPRKVLLPIRSPTQDQAGPQVILSVHPRRPAQVAIEKGRLDISAPNQEALHAAVLKVLRALDHRYDHPGTLPGTVFNRKLGLANTVLEPL